MKLRIATSQFNVSDNVPRNLRAVLRHMSRAANTGAGLVHFSEACLGGYAGVEFESFNGYDWECLRDCTEAVMQRARELRVWVVLGSHHPLTPPHRPHNSLYVINDRGQLVNRYDKLFCTGDPGAQAGDLKHYSPGSRLVVFTCKGIRCGLQICHDFRYPELYRQYKKRGVQLMLHSYHNGHSQAAQLRRSGNIWGVIVPPTTQAAAASNYMWISANNTSMRESSWPSFFVRPDGVITGRLARNRPGLLMSDIDTEERYYDALRHWRKRAISGIYHSGRLVQDPRSNDRRSL